jgi:hypothetical protein
VSLPWLQPGGQQPSPFWQAVMRGCGLGHCALQLAALPVSVSMVQASPSSQVVGQLPSQVSGASTVLLPQVLEQSLSLAWVQPAGQQPSPLAQVVTLVCLHCAEHVDAAPNS